MIHFRRSQLYLQKFSVVAGIFFLFLISPVQADAVGITPALTLVEGMLSNSTVDREVFFSRGDASKKENVTVIIAGPVAQYIEAPKGQLVELQPEEHLTPYPLIIHSEKLAEGEYEATIEVNPVVPSAAEKTDIQVEGAGSSMLAGAQGKIRFTIVNKERPEYTVVGLDVHDTEEGQPSGVTFRFINTGNVSAHPDKIEIQYTDTKNAQNVMTEVIEGATMPIIPAFSEEEIRLVTKTQLLQGTYSVKVSVYNKNKVIASVTDRKIDVFPVGSLAQSGEALNFQTDKKQYTSGEIAKFDSIFHNTGSVGATASLNIEIFRDGSRVDVVKTDSVFIPSGISTALSGTYGPLEPGNYSAQAYILYGVHKTDSSKTEFVVDDFSQVTLYILLGGSIIVLLILFFGVHRFFLKRKIKKNNSSVVGVTPIDSTSKTKYNKE